MSCEFANANASSTVIVNIGPGSPALFSVLRAGSASGGRTVTTLSGLGAPAFSISDKGLVRGTAVLTGSGAIYSLSTTLTLVQDETLTKQLEQLS